jgi:tRNA dimethylallyltransferase
MNSEQTPLICLAGPTASGKSAICQMLAEHLPIEIINVDSATIYRGMDIGTAKPSANERARVKHHLLDILDPSQSYSAAQFRDDALACVNDIRQRGRLPVLAGGTMLYFKILRDGMDDLPGADPPYRESIEAQAREQGWPALHQALSAIDPATAARLAPNDSQRIGRALEICHVAGQPFSSLIGRSSTPAVPITMISLEPANRQTLHSRIEARFDQMLEQGFVHEVRTLYERSDLHAALASMRCVGYRQIWQYLEGQCTLPDARQRGIAATRQLAKRQLTWLRSMPERHVIDSLAPDAGAQVLKLVQASAP